MGVGDSLIRKMLKPLANEAICKTLSCLLRLAPPLSHSDLPLVCSESARWKR